MQIWKFIQSCLPGAAARREIHERMSRNWKAATERNHGLNPCLYPPSPRVWSLDGTYTLAAILPYGREALGAPKRRLWLRTRSKAIAHYCIFGHGPGDLIHDGYSPVAMNPFSEAHDAICCRLRRCGAVEIDDFMPGEMHEVELAAYVQQSWKHAFGWPAPVVDKEGMKVRQPVWSYMLPDRPLYPEIPHSWDIDDGLEAIVGFEDLVGCNSMAEYCERLESWGALYYEDVQECREARELGLA